MALCGAGLCLRRLVLYVSVLLLQELVDSARRLLDSNTSQLQQLCDRSGFITPDDQGVHEAYGAAVKEWEGQMLQRYAGTGGGPAGCSNAHSTDTHDTRQDAAVLCPGLRRA